MIMHVRDSGRIVFKHSVTGTAVKGGITSGKLILMRIRLRDPMRGASTLRKGPASVFLGGGDSGKHFTTARTLVGDNKRLGRVPTSVTIVSMHSHYRGSTLKRTRDTTSVNMTTFDMLFVPPVGASVGIDGVVKIDMVIDIPGSLDEPAHP